MSIKNRQRKYNVDVDVSVASWDLAWGDWANYCVALPCQSQHRSQKLNISYPIITSNHFTLLCHYLHAAHVEVFALLQHSWIRWIGPYQDDELIISISCSCSLIINVDLKVFGKKGSLHSCCPQVHFSIFCQFWCNFFKLLWNWLFLSAAP